LCRMVRLSVVNVPLERRLQTLGALFWLLSTPIFACFFFLACALLFSYIPVIGLPLVLVYVTWAILIDKGAEEGGRGSKWVKKWKIWEYLRDFFPAQLINTATLDPSNNYIFCYHPHGILSIGAFICFATEAASFSEKYPGITLKLLTLKMNLWWPFYREYLMSVGCGSVSYSSCLHNLSIPGRSIMIVVGGASEALDAKPHTNNLTLKKRKGFVRVALTTGSGLVPVFGFGENDLFSTLDNAEGSKVRIIQNKMLKIFGYSLPFFFGRGIFNYDLGLLPYRAPLTVVVGEAIEVPKIEKPTKEDIDKYHSIYMEALQHLYDQYKDIYAKDRIQDLQFVH